MLALGTRWRLRRRSEEVRVCFFPFSFTCRCLSPAAARFTLSSSCRFYRFLLTLSSHANSLYLERVAVVVVRLETKLPLRGGDTELRRVWGR